MSTPTNSAEGGTSGTGVTTGNSGGASGTAFDQVTTSTSCTMTFDSTNGGAHGSMAYKSLTGATAGEAYVMWTTSLVSAATATIYVRAYLYLTANPGTQTRLVRWLSVSTVRGSIQINTSGKLVTTDSSGTTVATMTNAIPLNQWVRVEGFCTGDAAAGVLECKLFTTLDSTTPLETISNSTLNTGGTIDRVRLGQTGTGVANITYWMDDLGASDAGYLGPVVTAPALAPAAPRRRVQVPARRLQRQVAAPVPPQLNPPYPLVEVAQPRRTRGLRLRRGATYATVPPQFNPPYPTVRVSQPRRLRGTLARRGRFVVPTPAQVVLTPPAYPPTWARPHTRPTPARRRFQFAIPAPTALPPTAARLRVRPLLQRGRRAVALPLVIVTVISTPGNLIVVTTSAGQLTQTLAAQIAQATVVALLGAAATAASGSMTTTSAALDNATGGDG